MARALLCLEQRHQKMQVGDVSVLNPSVSLLCLSLLLDLHSCSHSSCWTEGVGAEGR